MKKQIFFLIFLLVSSFSFAQKVEFTLSVNKDTVLMNNLVQVKYSLKQANLNGFETPKFAHFQVVSGPMVSSSVSIVNGDRTEESSYSFSLRPDSPGIWTIPAASIETAQGIVSTKAKDIVVLPNPDGIQEDATPEQNGFFEHFFNRTPMSPPIPPEPVKKKRKTYRL